MSPAEHLQPAFDRAQKRALLVGGIALLLCAIGAMLNPAQFFRSYLFAYVFWIGIALGSFAIVMLHHMVGGGWGMVIRRVLESATRTLPLMAVLAIPILFGMRHLYEWARPDVVAHDELLQHKTAYLNVPFFVARMIFYFAVWLSITYFLNKWSAEQDRTKEPAIRTRLQNLSGPGLVLFGLTVTFASVDWVMSLEPHWFSTIYGAMFMVGQALTTLAFSIAILMLLADFEPFAGVLRPTHFHDLGNLMLAFVMLWAYIAFSQFLIIWSGNLPEEIPWYLKRLHGPWGWIAVALILFHFALPFLMLLSRQSKRRIKVLAGIAMAMIVMRLVDLFWIVTPAFHEEHLFIHWMDLAAPIGIGGIWVAVFVRQLKGRPLLPV